MYQLGLVRHATPGALRLNSSTDGGQAVAQTTFCSSSGKSPQKQAAPSGSIQIRPLGDPQRLTVGLAACGRNDYRHGRGVMDPLDPAVIPAELVLQIAEDAQE